MSSDGEGLLHEDEAALDADAPRPTASVPGHLTWLVPVAIVVACWFVSWTAATAAFGIVGSATESEFWLAALISNLFYWSVNGAITAVVWFTVWMVGVILITTWNRFARPQEVPSLGSGA